MIKSWLPLEANPELLSSYCHRIGLECTAAVCDVLSVEDWALDMLPGPAHAILLLYPLGNVKVDPPVASISSSAPVIFMKQNIENACGTIAVLHALLNLHAQGSLEFEEKSYVRRMYEVILDLTPQQRADWLASDEEITRAHASYECEGQSAAIEGDVDTHFIAFIPSPDKSRVIELDGRKSGPVDHGPITDDPDDSHGFGRSVLNVVKEKFIANNPDDIRFSILAMS